MKRKIKLSKCIKFFIIIIAVIFCIDILKNSFLNDIVVDGIDFITNIENRIGLTDYKSTFNKNQDDDLVLVNKDNPLSSDYKPKNLVKPNIVFLDSSVEEEKYMKQEAATSLEELFQNAKQNNITLIGTSAYRSYQTQVNVYNKYYKEKGKEYTKQYVATPGESEHQTGLAIDVTNPSRCFDKTSIEAQWLANNAYKYGFILRYPENKEDVTGYSYEPWHIRYVGKSVAEKIYRNSETLEEYLARYN